jgi:hypothetical protein
MGRYVTSVRWLILIALLFGFPRVAQSQQPSVAPGAESGGISAVGTATPADGQQPKQTLSGAISGRIVDGTGAAIAGAKVRLVREDQSADFDVVSGDDGQFSYTNIPPGAFTLTITSEGFATQTFAGTLRSGESFVVPQIALAIATAVAEVRVVPSQVEIAEDEIKEEEKQRALGFIPNFYVTYVPNAAPLTPKQKFELAWKTIIDPVTFGLTGAVAGLEQADNYFSGYGQGAEGYGKRYGAAYADSVVGTFIGSAILPSLLKQDPRYFYKGTGSKRSRVLYALANAVICKGDNGRWQANYSSILGSLAAGGISNLYYPAKDRNGASLTFENALIGIGANAAANLLQEFVIKKLTPSVAAHGPAKVQSMIEKFSTSLTHDGD